MPSEVSHYLDASGRDKITIERLQREIDDFLVWIFQHHDTAQIRGAKVIHDTVWKTNRYEKLEAALINTPLIQRLRNIHQTSFTYFTYPSSLHSRFEHVLGVVTQIEKLFSALSSKFQNTPEKKDLVDDNWRKILRIAALMHDCGHGPYSHTSEEIYRHSPEIQTIKKYRPFISAAPHEIFSALILSSEKFKEIFQKLKDQYNYSIANYDFIIDAIVGNISDPTQQYLIEMLHGPFDADKLDYLFRDGHFSGLPLHVDLDRLWYSLDVNSIEGRKRLTINWGGTSSLEQIIFAKMTLFPAVYHHHKVRASDCMFKGIIECIQKKKIKFNKITQSSDKSIAFSRASHFLYFTDFDVFNLNALNDSELHILIHDLQYRRLLKRAVVISVDTVEDPDTIDKFYKYLEIGPGYYRELASLIWEKAGKPGMLEQIWVDCPKDPDFSSAQDTWISPLGEDLQATRLDKFFKYQQYADQYKNKKWRGHVFCPHQHLDVIAKATADVFQERLGMKFLPIAFHLCHIKCPAGS